VYKFSENLKPKGCKGKKLWSKMFLIEYCWELLYVFDQKLAAGDGPAYKSLKALCSVAKVFINNKAQNQILFVFVPNHAFSPQNGIQKGILIQIPIVTCQNFLVVFLRNSLLCIHCVFCDNFPAL
jgi:hypothetical protein